jgi:hypothetical protein
MRDATLVRAGRGVKSLQPNLRRAVAICAVTVGLARRSVKLIGTSSVVQPLRDPGTSEHPETHDASDDDA